MRRSPVRAIRLSEDPCRGNGREEGGRDVGGQAEEEESGGFGWEFVGSEVSDWMVSGFIEYLWQGRLSKNRRGTILSIRCVLGSFILLRLAACYRNHVCMQ